jgi:hypothetical protein
MDTSGWMRLGEMAVVSNKDRGEIVISPSSNIETIKFRVFNAIVNLIEIQAYYDGGDKQIIQSAALLNDSDESHVFHLNGKGRNLNRLVIMYKMEPVVEISNRRMEIWGKKFPLDKL